MHKSSIPTNNDSINPSHYRIGNNKQLINLIRLLPFDLGNAIKYCYRNGHKNNAVEDLNKAIWYINDYWNNEIEFSQNITYEYMMNISEEVLTGLSDWEKETCQSIIKLFYNNKSNDQEEIYKNIIDSIHGRIAQLTENYPEQTYNHS